MNQRDVDSPLGRTRTERVHLRSRTDATSLEAFDLVRVLDADEDAHLAELARQGALHRLPDGTDLAEPYLYHERSRSTLVLVIPLAARHREMHARHELLSALDQLAAVPAYAFDFHVALDAEGLRSVLAERDEVEQTRLAETVSDDELAEVGVPGSGAEVGVPGSVVPGSGATEVGVPGSVPGSAPPPSAATELDDDTEVVALDEVEWLDDDEVCQPRVQSFLDVASGDYALVPAEWVSSFPSSYPDEDEGDPDEEDAVLLDEHDLVAVPESYSTLTELPRELPPQVAPPADFETDPRRLRAGLFRGTVWLFARTRPGIFERDGIDLAVQVASVGGRSIALVSLGDLTADRAETLRLATDLGSRSPRALLATLAKDFVVSVALFHEGREPVRCVQLRSPREANVARVLSLPTEPAEDAIDVETAIARALAAPPPLDSTEHPFQARRATPSAAEMRAELRAIARWLEPARRDRLRLGLGVPEAVIDADVDAALADALEKGIALPPILMQWAMSAELASSPAAIVAQQLGAFLKLTSEPERGGLRDAEVASNWNALRGAASAFEVPIPRAIIEVLHAMEVEEEPHDPGDLPCVNVAALNELTRHATHRAAATLELLRRDPGLHADTIGMALRDMRREEVLVLVPALRRAGEGVVPMLIDTLTAKKTFVRQAAALTLSSLHAEAALPGLLRLVAKESTLLWEEFARALAAFGELAEMAVIEAVERDAIPADRAALVLAYLSKGGFASGVAELERHPNPKVAAVARGVASRIPTVERHLREFYDASATPTGPREFGRRLFRALHPDTTT